jgi:hypothetical protein
MMKVLVGEISFIPKSRGQQLIFNFCAFGGLQIDLLPLQPPRQLDRSLRPPRLRVRLWLFIFDIELGPNDGDWQGQDQNAYI